MVVCSNIWMTVFKCAFQLSLFFEDFFKFGYFGASEQSLSFLLKEKFSVSNNVYIDRSHVRLQYFEYIQTQTWSCDKEILSISGGSS
jgi:hypothetical protein